MSEKYAKLNGKWAKMNDSGFEAFEAKNPGLATGKPGHNTDDIKLAYEMSDSGFTVAYAVDGVVKTCSFVYNGALEQASGEFKFTTTTEFVEGAGRMPGGSIGITYTMGDKVMKQENYQFHGDNRMIIETFANDAALVTVFERE